MDSRARIQAVTISVNYSDYLECIVDNRIHFDRWIIVTDPSDHRTIALCKEHGLEVHMAKRLYEDGARFAKAKALNDALAALDQTQWALVLDSDIYLPKQFRPRLDRQQLDPGCLYGMHGRRICAVRSEFVALKDAEPWISNVLSGTAVIGYFHLFHLDSRTNRYPERVSSDASTYDMVFSDSFPTTKRKYLPMTCLHLGPVKENWKGRTSVPFFDQPGIRASSNFSSLNDCTTRPDPQLARRRDRVVLTIGQYSYPPPAPIRDVAARYVLELPLHYWHRNRAMGKTDILALRDLFTRNKAASNIVLLKSPSSIPRDVNLVYLPFETDCDFLLWLAKHVLPRISPDALITGRFFNLITWPATTVAISVVLGTPEFLQGNFWCRSLRRKKSRGYPRKLPLVFPPRQQSSSEAVVYILSSPDDMDLWVVSLHGLRKFWKHRIVTYGPLELAPAANVAAARYDSAYRILPKGRTIQMRALAALNDLDRVSRVALSKPGTQWTSQSRPLALPINVVRKRIRAGLRQAWKAKELTRRRASWALLEAEAISSLTPGVPVAHGAHVISFASGRGLRHLLRNVRSWRFPSSVRAWLLGKEKHIEHFAGNGSCVWSHLRPGSAIASQIQTAPIIFLNPLAYATPGATLFVHQTWNERQIAFAAPPTSHDPARLRGCSSIWIGSAIQEEERLRAKLFQLPSFRSVMTFLFELYESRARLDHVTASGWQLVTRQ